MFPWAGPMPLVGHYEGLAGLSPNRLGPAQLMALSQACTLLSRAKLETLGMPAFKTYVKNDIIKAKAH
jgi:hypothetical protein